MDTLVARYSRPAYEQDESIEQDAQELVSPMENLSIKFAMPPVAQVSHDACFLILFVLAGEALKHMLKCYGILL